MNIPICPKCKKGTRRSYLYSTSTCMYSTVQFDENGKVLYYNPNITKDTYLCHACGIKFSVDNKGNIEEDTIVFVDSTYKNENKI